MDIWITHCHKERRCNFCPKKITLAEPMVEGKLWMVHKDKKKWPLKFAWHVDCWVKQGMTALEKKPYVPAGHRGRKPLALADDIKVARNKLLRRRAAAFFRLRAAADKGNINLVIRTMTLMEKITAEIEQYGGVPKTWIV